jgi:hypothetical protein
MNDVTFEEQDWQSNRFEKENEPSGLIKLVLKTGLVKEPKQASYVLTVCTIVFFVLAIYFFVSAPGGSSAPSSTPATVPAMPGGGP